MAGPTIKASSAGNTLSSPLSSEPLSAELKLALAHSARSLQPIMRTSIALDARLARIVSATNEPMLGQMRLAWWRDMLAKPLQERPRGDVVLDAIGVYWSGHEDALVAAVDGWEHLLADPFTHADATQFADGRAAPFGAFARLTAGQSHADICEQAGRRWAFADAAAHIGPGPTRDLLLNLAAEVPSPRSVPRPLRGIAVLDALAYRAIARGGRPLMEGRGAALVAARAAILGR